jgi:hypothetical protein
MAASALRLLSDPELTARIVREARAAVSQRFCEDSIVPLYERFYEKLLAGSAVEV